MTVPAWLLDTPVYDSGRYSPERRAWALRHLDPLPVTWHPKPRWLERGHPVGNILLAVADQVTGEIHDTRLTIRHHVRQTASHRKHLARLRKAQALSEDA